MLSSNSSHPAIAHPTDDFPEIDFDRPPMLAGRPKGVKDQEWRKVVAAYRSEKMAYEQARRNRKIADASNAKAVSKPAEPRKAVAKAPDRSSLLRTGELDVAHAPITHSSRKARARHARAAGLQWREAAKQSRKAGAVIKKLSPFKLATNPTSARLTGDAALAMNLLKRQVRAERKRTNDANRAAKLAAKLETRDAILDQRREDTPARRHARFPPPGAHKWADDEDVPTDDQVAWLSRHEFSRTRTSDHQLHCNLSGLHFWARSRSHVVEETPNLDPSDWKMVKGVYTFHGRLSGGAPPTRPPPVHGSSVPTVSEQLYSYVNVAMQPASITSLLTDANISWYTSCPDVVLLAFYGPRSSPTEDIVAQRTLNMLRGSRRPEPTPFYPPRDPTGATRAEVATWAIKIEAPNPHLAVPLQDEEHPIQLTVVVAGTPQVAYVRSLDDAVTVHQTIVDAGSAATLSMLTPTQVMIVVVPRMRGGSLPLRRSYRLRLLTPQGPHTLWFPSEREASAYLYRVSLEHTVVVYVDDEPDLLYEIRGRLPGGGKSKWAPKSSSQVDPAFVPVKSKKQQSREKEQANQAQKRRTDAEIAKKQAEYTAQNGSTSSSSSSSAPPSVMDEEGADPDYSEDETSETAMSRVRTAAADAKQSIMEVIKNRVVAHNAHVDGEPDWNESQSSWDLKFIHLGVVWYFDGRVEEADRIELMDYTATLPRSEGIELFSEHFQSVADQYLKDQAAFGWGARNFREFGGDVSKAISTPPSTPKTPNIKDLAHTWLMSRDPDTFDSDFVKLCRAVYTGTMTPPQRTELRAWAATNPGIAPPDSHTRMVFEAAIVRYCRAQDPVLTDPFCPLAPDLPADEEIPTYAPSTRYATELERPDAIMTLSGRLSNLPLFIHCKVAQFLQTAKDHTAEGYSMITGFVDTHLGHNRVAAACAKLAVATAFAGLPFATALACTLNDPVRFSYARPVHGLRMYSRQTAKHVLDEIVRVTRLFDPTQTKVTLSADEVWNDEQYNGSDAERLIEYPDTTPQPHVQWSPNPLYRLAASLTAATTQQVPAEDNDKESDLNQARAHVHAGEKLLVKHATVSAMTITSSCEGASERAHLLVCPELFALIVANYERYRSLTTQANPHVKLHSSVLTATLLSAKSFNIPVVQRSRTAIEHDTAVAATVAIWAHLRTMGSSDPYLTY